jgi:xylan 1,4-beta-xylosidase
MKRFDLDLSSSTKPLEHYWELCVGSGHATTALREDYRQQLFRCHNELGFKYVRFHGLFDDDMSVLYRPRMGTETVLSFTNVDSIFDFLLSIDMKPFVELGFMPECLSSKNTTIFHYKGNTSPPSSYEKWAWLIRTFTRHLIERYGRDEVRQWFFEVWNEPNLGGRDAPFGFWSGSMEDYFELYRCSAEAIKGVDAVLRVGGPATSNNSWIPEFLDFCRKSGTPVDFVSTHHYPTDAAIYADKEGGQNLMQLGEDESLEDFFERMKESRGTLWSKVDRGVLTEMTQKAVQQAGELPVYYTEWNSLAGIESDGPFGASFVVKTILDGVGLVKGYSYWTFSDVFEEGGMPHAEFHGGFGLLTLHNVAKPTYRAFELLHQLGEEIYEKHLADGTVDVYVIRKKASQCMQVVAVNHHSLQHEIHEERVQVSLSGIQKPDGTNLAGDLKRIDDSHANPIDTWVQMGSPDYLNDGQLAALSAASYMQTETISFQVHNERVELELTLPPMGMAAVNLYL